MTTLLDTSAWSLAFRRSPNQLSTAQQKIVSEIEQLITDGQSRMIGPTRQELLSGIRSIEEFDRLKYRLGIFPDEPLLSVDYEQAASVRNQCQPAGIASSPIDSLICAVALRQDWVVLTTDQDFPRYADVVPIRLAFRTI